MSQIMFDTYSPVFGKKVQVVTGWDRPCQKIHWAVYNAEPLDIEEEDFLAGNLLSTNPSPGHIPLILQRYGIPTPAGLVELLSRHAEEDAGNVIVRL